MTRLEALVGLNMVADIGSIRLKKLLEVFGEPENILKASPEKLMAVSGIGERIALVKALDEAVGGTNLNIEMTTSTNLQMYKAFETVIPETQRIKEDNWEGKFKSSLKAQLEQPMK